MIRKISGHYLGLFIEPGRVVPDELIAAIAIAGTSTECRERVEAYRRSGINLPIISPRLSGPDPKQQVIDAIRACAP